jgi:hypothetical protein
MWPAIAQRLARDAVHRLDAGLNGGRFVPSRSFTAMIEVSVIPAPGHRHASSS